MAHPAASASDFEPSLASEIPLSLKVEYRDDVAAQGPANRMVAALNLALDDDTDEQAGQSWSTGRTLRFVIATCCSFWAIAIAVGFYALH